MRKNIKLWAVLFWLVVWQVVSMKLNQQILLVSPVRVITRLSELIITKDFWLAIAFSASRIIGGFIIAVIISCLLAVLASRFKRIDELLAPFMLTIRSIPVASFIILALIWFSSKNLAILISFLMVMPVMYSNILTGIRTIDSKMHEMAKVFEIQPIKQVRYIYIPHIFKYFESACAVCLGLSWKSGVAAEVIGMPDGSIGECLQQAKVYLDTPDLFAWTLVIVCVSLFFFFLFLWLLSKIKILVLRMD